MRPVSPTMPAVTLGVVRHRHWLVGFVLHCATGFLATAAHYGVMWAFLAGGVSPVPASSYGFICGALSRFLLSYFHVFSPSVTVPAAMLRFVVVLSLQMMANGLLFGLLLSAHWPLWAAQVSATIVLTVFNYLAYRVWVFR